MTSVAKAFQQFKKLKNPSSTSGMHAKFLPANGQYLLMFGNAATEIDNQSLFTKSQLQKALARKGLVLLSSGKIAMKPEKNPSKGIAKHVVSIKALAKKYNAAYVGEKWNSPTSGAAYVRFLKVNPNEKTVKSLPWDHALRSSERANEIAAHFGKFWKSKIRVTETNEHGKTLWFITIL